MSVEPETTYKLAGWTGRALSLPYAVFMRFRRWSFHSGLRRSHSAGVPVICVGNITTGGTGKTPMVAWVVRQLVAMGRRPAILTRGYKAVAGRSDEAELLKELTGVEVVINPDRVAGSRQAVAGLADVLVMDDGFQHMRLNRELNIVLIDATNPFGSGPGVAGCCLPAGRLREPRSALRDADVIVITRKNCLSPEEITMLGKEISASNADAVQLTAEHEPVEVIDEAGRSQPLAVLNGRRVFAFCGLGNPESFIRTILDLGGHVAGSRALRDHANYTPKLIAELCVQAEKCGAAVLLTTRKDGVKLDQAEFDRPVWQLGVEMKIDDPQGLLAERIGAIF